MGLSGIAITDHEALCSHMEVNQYAKKIREKNPDFTIVLGNEVYLVDKREPGIKYNHCILAAKDGGDFIHFDMVPEELEIRRGPADYTGRFCVIGAGLKEDAIEHLFFQ